jgi:hypothetical protein
MLWIIGMYHSPLLCKPGVSFKVCSCTFVAHGCVTFCQPRLLCAYFATRIVKMCACLNNMPSLREEDIDEWRIQV